LRTAAAAHGSLATRITFIVSARQCRAGIDVLRCGVVFSLVEAACPNGNDLAAADPANSEKGYLQRR